MSIYINGELFDSKQIAVTSEYQATSTPDFHDNVKASLTAWRNNTGFGFGEPGPGFLNVSTSGTTGYIRRVYHSRETIEQVVDSNVKTLNLSKSARIVSFMTPRSIGFTVLGVFLAERLGCDLFIETFKGLSYIDRINELRPTHHCIFPNMWKTMHTHPKWENLNFSDCDTLLTGSDFLPLGMLNELRQHGPRKVYNAYASTEVPPYFIMSEEENVYYSRDLPEGAELKIEDNQVVCRWSSQPEWWVSGDFVEGSAERFSLVGRKHNMFKQDTVHVYPEQVEKLAIKHGARLSLCQQIGNQCVLHYTGTIQNLDEFKKNLSHIPRFRLKPVAEIQMDNNLGKVIRNQTFS